MSRVFYGHIFVSWSTAKAEGRAIHWQGPHHASAQDSAGNGDVHKLRVTKLMISSYIIPLLLLQRSSIEHQTLRGCVIRYRCVFSSRARKSWSAAAAAESNPCSRDCSHIPPIRLFGKGAPRMTEAARLYVYVVASFVADLPIAYVKPTHTHVTCCWNVVLRGECVCARPRAERFW